MNVRELINDLRLFPLYADVTFEGDRPIAAVQGCDKHRVALVGGKAPPDVYRDGNYDVIQERPLDPEYGVIWFRMTLTVEHAITADYAKEAWEFEFAKLVDWELRGEVEITPETNETFAKVYTYGYTASGDLWKKGTP